MKNKFIYAGFVSNDNLQRSYVLRARPREDHLETVQEIFVNLGRSIIEKYVLVAKLLNACA